MMDDERPIEDEPVLDPQTALQEFEELDLTVVLGQFFRYPVATLTALRLAIGLYPQPSESFARAIPGYTEEYKAPPVATLYEQDAKVSVAARLFQIVMWGMAIGLAVVGGTVMVANHPLRTENPQLIEGARWFLASFLAWLIGDLAPRHREIRAWLGERTRTDWLLTLLWAVVLVQVLHGLSFWFDASDEVIRSQVDTELVTPMIATGAQQLLLAALGGIAAAVITYVVRRSHKSVSDDTVVEDLQADLPWYMRIHPARPFLLLMGSSLSVVTWLNTANNSITDLGLLAWFGSVFMWTMGFAPRRWWNVPRNIREQWTRIRTADYQSYAWVIVVLAVIVGVGAHYRLVNLNGDPANRTAIPGEMTSDHVEKILDAIRVQEGSRNIFFANNGGREPFQMYAMAVFALLPGQGMNYESLKLLAVIESILTLPFMFWLGYDLLRTERPRVRLLVGLALAGLVAVSFWDTTITRLGLRIVLTPLVASILLVYLARAMRSNSMGDYLKAGLVLGFGLYTYQAVRMLPVVVVLGAVMAFIFIWRRRTQRVTVVLNLMALVIVAVMTFLPMIHYTTQYPEQFLRRTFGRLLGDDVIEETLPNGMLVLRDATSEERINAFVGNLPVLFSNIRNAILMFHWKGDVAWISNYPNYPAFDAWSGALLWVGAAAWMGLAWRRRDPVYAMIPLSLAIMLLPSALSIAYPIENPSFTRTSGALPMAYLIAALPLALIVDNIVRLRESAVLRMLGAVVFMVPLAASYSINYHTYMYDFPESYIKDSLPHSEGGRILREFVESGGTFGNAFLVASPPAYPNWWDHRAVGLAAGMEARWPNGVYDNNPSDDRTRAVDYVPDFMGLALSSGGEFQFDPNRPMLFFYHQNDVDTSAQLREWFPEGREVLYPSYQPGDDFLYYEAPPLGQERMIEFLTTAGVMSN